MTMKEIQKLIQDFEKSELTELELEFEEVKLKLSKNKNKEINYVQEKNVEEAGQIVNPQINLPETEIKSPLVGTFYSSANPNAQPFVTIGSKVKKGDVVCIIEAMKIMNEITSTVDGQIDIIHFNNGDVVGFNDNIFTVKTNANNSN